MILMSQKPLSNGEINNTREVRKIAIKRKIKGKNGTARIKQASK